MNDGGLHCEDRRGIPDGELWATLPIFLRKYYLLKGWYYNLNRTFISFAIAGVVLLAGIASFVLKVNPLFSIILILLGLIIGVVTIWEIERQR